ncbi:MAG: Gfo/Idh/MocA family protein [Planctomycetota bacterium]|jgi:predicted dehydrogenase
MNRNVLSVVLLVVIAVLPFEVRGAEKVFRLGMIGLDTSHVTAFTKLINNSQAEHGCKVVVGYSGGSPDIPDSAGRVEDYTRQLRDQYGVEIVDSIEELCRKVDGVLLESVDGRPHLKQARPVIEARKPLFIDKPMAGNLADVLEIFRLARENNVPCWSSSSLRYCPGIVEMKEKNTVGKILGCDVYSPCHLEEHHPDLYWYGVHGVEMLFAVMGPGCESVRRVQTDAYEHVVGLWKDGRIGTFRGLHAGKTGYGGTIFGDKFFKTGKVPVPAEETIEIFAFMSAADASKEQGGRAVSLSDVIADAKKRKKAR